MMGNNLYDGEKPIHKVRVSSFQLGETEITNWQYNIYAQQMKKRIEFGNWQPAGDNPVIYISWYDTQRYIAWLSEKTGLKYRLPTEAEWEFAAIGGIKSLHYRYSGSNDSVAVAWCFQNSKNRTQAVKNKRANELGLYDMNGNVWEWCSDFNSYIYYQACEKKGLVVNPQGPEGAELDSRTIRGGCWNMDGVDCNPSIRGHKQPDDGSLDFIGFRVAASK